MHRTIDLKHIGAKGHVRGLLETRIDHLEERLTRFPTEAVSVHALFEESGKRKLYRLALACHVPGHIAAAHEEGRDAGMVIRRAFTELERQLQKQNAQRHRLYGRGRRARQRGGSEGVDRERERTAAGEGVVGTVEGEESD